MTQSQIPKSLLARMRKICLALPAAEEVETWGHPTFRVNDKIFAGLGFGEQTIGEETREVTSTSLKAKARQKSLLAIGPPFFFPKYVGAKGWIGIELNRDTDWELVEELLVDSWKQTAPRKLVSEFEEN